MALVLAVPLMVAAALAMRSERAADAAILGASPGAGLPVAFNRPAPQQGASIPVFFLQMAPAIYPGATPPHGNRGRCRSCHKVLSPRPRAGAAAAGGPGAAAVALTPPPCGQGAPGGQVRQVAGNTGGAGPWTTGVTRPGNRVALAPTPVGRTLRMMPFQEAHWQGLELITLTPALGKVLKIPRSARGVIVDEATMPADVQGFIAGDLIMAVDDVPTPDLESFVKAAFRVRDRQQVRLDLLRKRGRHAINLASIQGILGTANGETAPMIKPGSRSPHNYMGPCTRCHHIGTNGQMAVDLGDTLTKQAPPIRYGQTPPHQNRGRCSACHAVR